MLPVAVFHPDRDLYAGIGHGREQRLVEQLVPHATINALDLVVLHRSAWGDVMPLHADLAAPCQPCITGGLVAIVADDHGWLATLRDQLGQLTNDTAPRDRRVRHR